MTAPTNLFEYYASKGQPLPPLSERAKLYEQMGLGTAADYITRNKSGDASVNNDLLRHLESPNRRQSISEAVNQKFLDVSTGAVQKCPGAPTGIGKYLRYIAQGFEQAIGSNSWRMSDVGDDPKASPPPLQQSLADAAKGVNPDGGTVNCGNIIDAVYKRLRGIDPNAIAPINIDGGWDDINSRYNTNVEFGKSFDDAFNAVAAGGSGTIGIIGLVYADGNQHVIMIANENGKVGIVEGQQGGHVIDSAKGAEDFYTVSGQFKIDHVGFGIVPPPAAPAKT